MYVSEYEQRRRVVCDSGLPPTSAVTPRSVSIIIILLLIVDYDTRVHSRKEINSITHRVTVKFHELNKKNELDYCVQENQVERRTTTSYARARNWLNFLSIHNDFQLLRWPGKPILMHYFVVNIIAHCGVMVPRKLALIELLDNIRSESMSWFLSSNWRWSVIFVVQQQKIHWRRFSSIHNISDSDISSFVIARLLAVKNVTKWIIVVFVGCSSCDKSVFMQTKRCISISSLPSGRTTSSCVSLYGVCVPSSIWFR